jgi:hypothetical protein
MGYRSNGRNSYSVPAEDKSRITAKSRIVLTVDSAGSIRAYCRMTGYSEGWPVCCRRLSAGHLTALPLPDGVLFT